MLFPLPDHFQEPLHGIPGPQQGGAHVRRDGGHQGGHEDQSEAIIPTNQRPAERCPGDPSHRDPGHELPGVSTPGGEPGCSGEEETYLYMIGCLMCVHLCVGVILSFFIYAFSS